MHCGTGIWRSSKNVNNLIEQDTRGVKQRIAAMLGFKGLSNAAITIGLSAPAALFLNHQKSSRANCATVLKTPVRT